MKNYFFGKKIIMTGMIIAVALSSGLPVLAKNKQSTKNPPVEHFKKRSLSPKALQQQSLPSLGAEAPSWGGRVSFTFDDGNVNVYQNGLPVLKKYNLKGVLFPVVGAVNNNESWSVNWSQLKEFQNAGWEIGSHTMTHPDLTKLTTSQLQNELSKSKSLLVQHGFSVKTMAFPYGEMNSKVLDYTTRYYENSRLAWGDNGLNVFPYKRYNIVAQEVSSATSPEEVIGWIDQAMEQKVWLVLMLHGIVSGEPVDEYQYNSAKLEEIAGYVSANSVPCVTISEAMKYPLGANLIKNPNLESVNSSGWALNWQRNNTKKVTTPKVSVNRIFSTGRYLKIVGGNTEYSASPEKIILPDSQKTYLFNMFSQLSMTGDYGMAVYVDEYDSNDQYIGGQWIGGIYASTFDETGFLYKPASSQVNRIVVNVYSEQGASATFFGDNFFFGTVN